jgi:hypothetical protein
LVSVFLPDVVLVDLFLSDRLLDDLSLDRDLSVESVFCDEALRFERLLPEDGLEDSSL